MKHTEKCRADHLGPWACYPPWLSAAVKAIDNGTWAVIVPEAIAPEADAQATPRRGFQVIQGIARIPLVGPLMKGDSKFGGTSTVRASMAVRAAARAQDVRGIMLDIDSPGGSVAGTEELGNDVAAAAQVKEVRAHIDDLGASAAFWIASQAKFVTANPGAIVGSIGTVVSVVDSSEAAEKQGLKVHVISTGEHKGAFTPGTEITEAHIKQVQEIIDAHQERFLAAVSAGRGLTGQALQEVADGSVFAAPAAKAKGLIDSIMSREDALRSLIADTTTAPRRNARARFEIEKNR